MHKKYTLQDAKEFAKEFENVENLSEINFMKLAKSIKMFAEKNEDTYFKRMINKYLELTEIYSGSFYKESVSGKNVMGEKNYSFLEFICSSMDNLYTIGFFSDLNKKSVKEGNSIKMFKENYSIREDLEEL